MTRPMCGILSVLALAAINVHASAPFDAQRPDFSGTYTVLPDRTVETNQRIPGAITPPELTSGRTVVPSFGTQLTITQTATQVTIRVVSGATPAGRYYLPAVDGTYALDHSTTRYIDHSKQVGSLSWRGAALDLILTEYRSDRSETPAGRAEFVFRLNSDDTLTVAYLTGSSAHDMVRNGAFRTITSVYQRSMP